MCCRHSNELRMQNYKENTKLANIPIVFYLSVNIIFKKRQVCTLKLEKLYNTHRILTDNKSYKLVYSICRFLYAEVCEDVNVKYDVQGLVIE